MILHGTVIKKFDVLPYFTQREKATYDFTHINFHLRLKLSWNALIRIRLYYVCASTGVYV